MKHSQFFSMRLVPWPTWKGWLVILFLPLAALMLYVRAIGYFLQPDSPVEGAEALVVEGWIHDSELPALLLYIEKGQYPLVLTTGGPFLSGSDFCNLGTYAEAMQARLVHLGLDPAKVVAVPAGYVPKDRSYQAASCLKAWLALQPEPRYKLNLCSVGAHSRRSWLLFSKALSPTYSIGIISLEDPAYRPDNWWHNSAGVKSVVGETLYYLYARFFFHPEASGSTCP
jgi:hypothetical protein